MNKFDVIIIGAGPAGSTAAYLLAKEGVRVAILDKAIFPRNKICGGGIVSRALKYLPDILEDVDYNPVNHLSISEFQYGERINIQTHKPLIYLIERKEFDFKLLNKAIQKGVKLFENQKVSTIDFNDSIISVRSGNVHLEAPIVIGADGAMGFTEKLVNGTNLIKSPAIEIELETTGDSDVVFFDFGATRRGYAWIFPGNNSTSIGIVSINSKDNLNIALKNYLHHNNISFKTFKPKGFVISHYTPGIKINTGNLILTGDALGLADPITFEGISHAILSGKLAARSILSTNSPATAVYKYKDLIKTNILKELFYANLLAYLVYKKPSVRKYLIKNYGFKLAMLVARIANGETSYEKEIKLISNYFKFIKYRLRK